jgi:acylphosphatase
MPTIHLLISGDVQGVFFRASAKEVANGYGLTGWVKNTNKGEVEVMVTGGENELQQFITWCRNGPPKARVDSVSVTNMPETIFKKFSIIR